MTSFTTASTNYPEGANTSIRRVRNPGPPTTSTIKNFILGDEWIDTSASPKGEWWKLVNQQSGGLVWVKLTSSTGFLESLTGNSGGPVDADSNNNINVVGDATTIDIVGNPGTHTLTASVVGGAFVEDFVTNVGGPVSPDGSGQIFENASTSTYTDGSTAHTIKTELQGTNHALFLGRGTHVPATTLGVATNGQLPIGSTGADPVLAHLTSTGNTVIITNGAGSINLEAAGTPSAFTGFMAYLSANQTNATGDGTLFTPLYDVVQFDTASGYNPATGVYTIPATGNYIFFANTHLTNINLSTHDQGNITVGGYTWDIGNPADMSLVSSQALSLSYSFVQSFTAGDTLHVAIDISSSTAGAKTVTVAGNVGFYNHASNFGGYLLQGVGSPGSFQIAVQTFTSNGTYTPTFGMKYCTIEVCGAGGGGGGTTTTGAGEVSASAGGGGGGYGRKTVSAATIGVSKAVTVGAGGTAGAVGGGTGGTGGTTSVGVIVSATGGIGGGGSATGGTSAGTPGAGGNGSSGDINVDGGAGNPAIAIGSVNTGISGGGGNSYFGGGGAAIASSGSPTNGNNGTTYGGGGGGTILGNSQSQKTGGTGAAGVVVITEFI